MDGVARLDDRHDLLRVAVDDRDLSRVAEGEREEVLPVAVVLGLRGPLVGRHEELPCLLHLLERHLRRQRRVVLDVARHQIDLLVVEDALPAPVGHAARRAVRDERFQHDRAVGPGLLGKEVRARRALAEHAVAAGAPVVVDLLGLGQLRRRELRRWRQRGLGGGLGRLLGRRRRGGESEGDRGQDRDRRVTERALSSHLGSLLSLTETSSRHLAGSACQPGPIEYSRSGALPVLNSISRVSDHSRAPGPESASLTVTAWRPSVMATSSYA